MSQAQLKLGSLTSRAGKAWATQQGFPVSFLSASFLKPWVLPSQSGEGKLGLGHETEGYRDSHGTLRPSQDYPVWT
jgi:hypothetical protein